MNSWLIHALYLAQRYADEPLPLHFTELRHHLILAVDKVHHAERQAETAIYALLTHDKNRTNKHD